MFEILFAERTYVSREDAIPQDWTTKSSQDSSKVPAIVSSGRKAVSPMTSSFMSNTSQIFRAAIAGRIILDPKFTTNSQTPVLASRSSMKVLNLNNEALNRNVRDETVASIRQIEVPSSQTPSNVGPIKKSPNNKRTYTPEDLDASLNAVLFEGMAPVRAIDRYKIPRRTFFRHLKEKRIEHGILSPNNRRRSSSRPSSRTSTPTTSAASSTQITAETAAPNSLERHLSSSLSHPASGTNLHNLLNAVTTSIVQNSAADDASTLTTAPTISLPDENFVILNID